jgi:putative salt-induced outer membrane protein YdiY
VKTVLFIGILSVVFFSNNLVSAGQTSTPLTGGIFAGYNRSNGNTNKSVANMRLDLGRLSGRHAASLKGGMSYSSNNDLMDGQKWDVLGRYSYDFIQEGEWFTFYQFLADHDRFADIHYRLTPSAGFGYHLARLKEWEWSVDAGFGVRFERHRVNPSEDDVFPTAIVHTFMKKTVFSKAFLSEDFVIYPGLEAQVASTIRSETVFSNPLTDRLSTELRYILDYNTAPSEGSKKSDIQLLAGVNYTF